MQHQVLGAEGKGTLDFAAKGVNTLLAHLVELTADIHQVARMNHQRAHIELGSQLFHARGLFGVDFGGAPHARARRKNLKSVGAYLTCALDGVRGAARRAQMDPDALDRFDHGNSLAAQTGSRNCLDFKFPVQPARSRNSKWSQSANSGKSDIGIAF